MDVLVTGATGFLGQRVVPRLVAGGARVTAHGRSSAASPFSGDVEYVRGDLADAAAAATLLAPWRWQAVVNLAGPVTGGGETAERGREVIADHVRIALHLRRHAAAARIVHTSSMTVYGLPDALPVTEDHARRPRHAYGVAKMLAEDVLLSDPALDAWVLRLPGLFSADRRAGALYHFCRGASQGETLKVATPAPTPWDVLDVDDAADAVVRAVHASGHRGGAINIAHGEPVELVAIATHIAAHAGRGSRVEATPGVSHPVFQQDIARARALLAWNPPSLAARLARLYERYVAEAG